MILFSGMITYRVLQMEDGVESVPQIVTTGTNFPNSNVQQVLTSNINGQVFVIGSSNDVFAAQAGTRAIAPRSSVIDGSTSANPNIKRVSAFFFLRLFAKTVTVERRASKGHPQRSRTSPKRQNKQLDNKIIEDYSGRYVFRCERQRSLWRSIKRWNFGQSVWLYSRVKGNGTKMRHLF